MSVLQISVRPTGKIDVSSLPNVQFHTEEKLLVLHSVIPLVLVTEICGGSKGSNPADDLCVF